MTATHELIARDARCVFSESTLPARFGFFGHLSPLNQRLFVRDLWQALSLASIERSSGAAEDLVRLVDEWAATADFDSAPEVLEKLRAPKVRRPVSPTEATRRASSEA